jgi:predicted transcriptional regulator
MSSLCLQSATTDLVSLLCRITGGSQCSAAYTHAVGAHYYGNVVIGPLLTVAVLEGGHLSKNVLTALDRATRLLGPRESRIMRQIWTGVVPEEFVVRDVQRLMPELAYTTVMTVLNRLTEKGLLRVKHVRNQKAHAYRAAGTPEQFLARAGREQVEQVVERFGDVAIAAFAERLDSLSAEQLDRLKELGRR